MNNPFTQCSLVDFFYDWGLAREVWFHHAIPLQ